jgi:hypothetical protein
MGVGVVMTGRRLAERFTLVILLVLRMGGGVGIIEVRWRRMAEEDRMPTRTMVHHPMQRHHEQGDHQTQAHYALHRHRLMMWEPRPCQQGLLVGAVRHSVSCRRSRYMALHSS